ncbi:uncharacterized protein UDID_18150 [Ustilago sp. UG-2017a]|nr:uncharacterized protein UDID_18150 [Ustilago sp. UG-2017a]
MVSPPTAISTVFCPCMPPALVAASKAFVCSSSTAPTSTRPVSRPKDLAVIQVRKAQHHSTLPLPTVISTLFASCSKQERDRLQQTKRLSSLRLSPLATVIPNAPISSAPGSPHTAPTASLVGSNRETRSAETSRWVQLATSVYAASGRSSSPLSLITASRNNQSSSSNNNVPSSHLATPSSALNNKSSSETLSASNASKVAGSRSGPTSKGGSIFKTSSNPNLRNDAASFATPPLPLASPASLTPSQSMSSSSAYPTAISPGHGAFPSAGPCYDSSNYAATSTASAQARSTSVSAAVPGNTASAAATGSSHESKRRPSLPSILEKATHPAASLRAALASGSSSNQTGGSMSQASSSRYLDHSFDGGSRAIQRVCFCSFTLKCAVAKSKFGRELHRSCKAL